MGKRARTDLCVGRPAMVVPTATVEGPPANFARSNFLLSRRWSR